MPDDFRFSVKIPKSITHDARLTLAERPLDQFIGECSHLGLKLGCLLVQLPPSLKCETRRAADFFKTLRELTDVPVACEPRHFSWFTCEADALLRDYRIGGVIADPCPHPDGTLPTGWNSLAYYRLHGSPRMYYSNYTADFLAQLASRLQEISREGRTGWCIFDNTAEGAAIGNGLELSARLNGASVTESAGGVL